MITIEGLVRDYGYWIILVGTYFDHYGVPLFLVFGGITASQGLLNVYAVLFCGFAGGWIADIFLYFLGYKTGLDYWMQLSVTRKLIHIVRFTDKMFRRQPAVMIILGRFLFIVSKFIPPFAGMIRYNFRNYALYSFSGNIIFSITYTFGSYFAGNWILSSKTGLQVWNLIFGVVFFGLMVLLTRRILGSSAQNREPN